MSPLVLHPARRIQDEQVEFGKLIERITSQFPELDEELIVNAVRGEYSRFETSTVRDFVPILVERSVRAELTHNHVGRRA
jgi:hypothetical protein